MADKTPVMEHGRLPQEKQKPLEERQRRRQEDLQDIRAFFIKLVFLVLAGWLMLGVIFGVAVMDGEEMYPRIRDGDVMVFYRLQQEYHIGDVATFTRDDQRYTGRIVAQGGDTVDITEEGQLLVNGSVQEEEIFYPTLAADSGVALPCEIPQGAVFLLCDFRTNGTDSRVYGPVEVDALDGKVMTILRRRGI